MKLVNVESSEMHRKNQNRPEIDKGELKILEEQKTRWLIEAPSRPDERGLAKLTNGQIEAEWHCPQNLPVICVILKGYVRGERSEVLRELGVLTLLLELGCWAEQRVVVFKCDSQPGWCEKEVFAWDPNASDSFEYWDRGELSYEESRNATRRLLERLIPFDYEKRKSFLRSSSYLHEYSRYDCLNSLIGTTLSELAKRFLPKEWRVEDDKMCHRSGFEVLVPPALPAGFTIRAEIPEQVIHPKMQKQILVATLRLCSERVSGIDFDRPYQTLIRVFDNPNSSVYFEQPSDWAVFCKHMEGWLAYGRVLVQ